MEDRAGETGTGPEAPACSGETGETEMFDFRPFLPLLPFFRDFHPGEIERLLSFGKILARPRRSRLYQAGSPATSAYLVIRGSVECSVRRGGELQLSVIGPGRICGANEMISRRDRKTGAGTRTGALLLELDREAFAQLFNGETSECLKFQKAVGINQLGDLKSANNLLALLVNQAHIHAWQ
jgi:CRP-like cAMP-binding protein